MKTLQKQMRIRISVEGKLCAMCPYSYDSNGTWIPHCGLFQECLNYDKDNLCIRCQKCITKFGKDNEE